MRCRLAEEPAPLLFAQLGEQHDKTGDHGEATRVARAGLARDPSVETAEVAQAPQRAPLASATLAEFYLRQGHIGRALETYRQVLAKNPADGEGESRLAEIESLARARAGDERPREARRRALERTIEGLETLLIVARRR